MDRGEFEDLVREHHPYILRLCLSILRDPGESDEAAQDTFIKAWRSRDSWRGDSSFQTWLHRIAVNRCRDLLRARKRRRTVSFDALIEEAGEAAGGSTPDRSKALENTDLAARLLELLPEAYRTALTLREVEGMSYEEIAKSMDCSVDSVKARLRRARALITGKLRHLLEPGGV